jgi:hypothetical protein
MILSYQAQLDEIAFPFQNKEKIENYQFDQAVHILFRTESDIKWIPYHPMHISNYTRVHFDVASNIMVMHFYTEVKMFTIVTQIQWLKDLLYQKPSLTGRWHILLEYPIAH